LYVVIYNYKETKKETNAKHEGRTNMLDTVITIELEHRARQKELKLKNDIKHYASMHNAGCECGAIKFIIQDSLLDLEEITKDIFDYEGRKAHVEFQYKEGLITQEEAEYLIERDAFKTFFE
jgi:hypothetical protein